MSDFVQLWDGGPYFAQSEHFRLGTDSVLLADFANTAPYRNGIDLGCGSGILPLLLLWRSEKLRMTGLEILGSAADSAEENMLRNGLSERCGIVRGDIRDCRSIFRSGQFDLVISNPPYFPTGSGKLPQDASKAAARGELSCTLDDICAAAAYLCRTGGSFCLVHRTERMAELMMKLSSAGLEPKRLRLVAHTASSAPSLVLLEARRGAKPGLTVLPTLVIRSADGSETDEILKIYHREEVPP